RPVPRPPPPLPRSGSPAPAPPERAAFRPRQPHLGTFIVAPGPPPYLETRLVGGSEKTLGRVLVGMVYGQALAPRDPRPDGPRPPTSTPRAISAPPAPSGTVDRRSRPATVHRDRLDRGSAETPRRRTCRNDSWRAARPRESRAARPRAARCCRAAPRNASAGD